MKGFELFRKNGKKRLIALALAAITAFSGIPVYQTEAADPVITTVADPESLHRPIQIYENNTYNEGKITVGKSVSDSGFEGDALDGVALNGMAPAENNFLVTLSQSSQIMGMAKEIAVPVDVVFVLDTSNSMSNRYTEMVAAANAAISTLMEANPENRVGVVAFSSRSGGQGGGPGGGGSVTPAANVLSELAHYTGDAATEHLQMVDEDGTPSNRGSYIGGRTTTGAVGGIRDAVDGGTNIHAGVAKGASLLETATTTVEIEGKTYTRIPFMVILSDGAPTYSVNTTNWYNSTSVGNATDQMGPGNAYYAANGFLPALSAAYYKGKITDHYYGTNANEENRCYIYTVGVDIEAATESAGMLARLTLDPANYMGTTGNWYTNGLIQDFNEYWNDYKTGSGFYIEVSNGDYFNITANSISATTNYVNGNRTVAGTNQTAGMYSGGIGYNDDYFDSNSNSLTDTFESLVELIQLKAISLPTAIAESADFSGHVHFYDPIGEYMEVKTVHGIVAEDRLFQGRAAARKMLAFNNPGDVDNDPEFDAALISAFNGRMTLSGSSQLTAAQIGDVLETAAANNVLYFTDTTDYSNSICWWGRPYTNATTGDEYMQFISAAPGDSIEKIEAAKVGNTVPADAEYVCRSYYYYGTAAGTTGENLSAPVRDALLFTIRVQRSLEAPYQQTVYVDIPGSLLSTERVLITEKASGAFEAVVKADDPVRVIYEVGLREDINEFNVADIVSDAYKNEVVAKTAEDSVSVDNYVASTDTYHFYTNDWDRSKDITTHLRAYAHAGFDIAEDNDYYTYTSDRLLYKLEGSTYVPVSADSELTPGNYYYKRDYYDWSNGTVQSTDAKNGLVTYTAVKYDNDTNTVGGNGTGREDGFVHIELTADHINDIVKKVDSSSATAEQSAGWYIKKGTHTAASLSVVDDPSKEANNTGTSNYVAHPVKSDDVMTDTHYTVYLGNNGRLALAAQKSKDVTISRPNENTEPTIINNADGQTVTVGDELTYTITVKNTTEGTATVVVTDSIPDGTEYVSHTDATGTITSTSAATDDSGDEDTAIDLVTWTFADMAAGASTTVTMTVRVTEAVLDAAVVSVENEATVKIDNTVLYTTNIVDNPPTGKKVEATDPNVDLAEGIKVGDELRYTIEYANTSGQDNATVVIVDNVPAGTELVEDLIYPKAGENVAIGLTNNNQTITWTLTNVQKDATGIVNFVVVVTEDAETPVENEAVVTIGENSFTTNSTGTSVLTGNLEITKAVTNNYYTPTADSEVYKLKLSTRVATVADVVKMGRVFDIQSSIAANNTKYADYQIEFVDGVATQLVPKAETTGLSSLDLTIAPGETLTIVGIPAGAEIMAEETAVVRGNVTETLAEAGYTVSGTGAYAAVAASGTATANITITNTYEPADSVYRITGVKQLTTTGGAVIGATPFDMGIWKANAEGTIEGSVLATVIASVDSTASGSSKAFKFKDNTVTAAEVLAAEDNELEQYFVVKELQSDMIGVTYDTTEYLVKITTTDNGQGELVSSYQYKTRANASAAWGDTWTTSTEVPASGDIALVKDGATADETFVNNFAPLEYTLELSATKTLTGRDIAAGEFSYVVVDAATNKEIATGTAGAAAMDDSTGVATSNITFTTMKFQKAGEYTLKVYELNSGRADVTYDTAVFTVKVNVVQDGGQLKLADTNGITYSATRAGNDSATGVNVTDAIGTALTGIEFNNTYGTFTLDGTKTVRNSDGTAASILDSEYDFVIYDAAGNPVGGGSHGSAAPASGDATADIDFNTLSYYVTAEELAAATANNAIVKTLKYTIKEIKPTAGLNLNMDYDETVWTVEVPVRYDWSTGKVYVNESEITYAPSTGTANNTGAAFTNIQHPSSVTVVPSAQKSTSGTLGSDITFSFAVRTADGSPVSVGTVAANNNAQPIDFHEIEYTRPGTYNYWLLETNTKTEDSGVKYDSDKYRMEVVITRGEDGNPEGMLAVKSVKYYGLDSDKNANEAVMEDYGTLVATDVENYVPVSGTDILFENEYSATGHINITAKKSLTATNSTGMAANQFAFRLERLNKEADGTFTNTGRYINGVNGAAAAGEKATVSFATINFSDDMFADGVNEAYIYARMSEIDLGAVGYDYDDTTYRLEIKLTREGVGKEIVSEVTSVTKETWSNGSITATEALASSVITNGTNSAALDVTFENSYTPVTPGSVAIVAEKNLTGRNLINGEFTFDLYHIVDGGVDSNGNITNTSDSNVVFLDSESVVKTDDETGTVTFTRHYPVTVNTGTYVYMIKERNEGKTGIVYDEEPVFAYVSVQDVDGHITATLHDSKTDADAATNGKTVVTDTFNNIFATYTPAATKKLTGRALIANGFSFEVREMTKNASDDYTAGNIVSTGTNKANGTVEFAPLYFSQAGTYYYEISEIRGTNGAVKYDTTKYYLKVDVAANGTVTPTYYASDDFDTAAPIAANTVVFNNAYEANGTIQLKATKELTGRPASMREAEFTFEIRTTPDRTGTLIAGGENKADDDTNGVSDITFGLLTYTQDNFDESVKGEAVSGDAVNGYTHTYYMMEIRKDTAATGITYSDAVYKVDVTVKDDGYGVLSTSAVYTRYSGSTGAGDLINGVPTFTNTYTAAPVSFTLAANKSLLGKALKEAFNFTVKEQATGTEVAWGTNAAPSGMVTFDADKAADGIQNISVTTAGIHDFIIEESTTLPTPIVGDGKTAGSFTRDTTQYLARVNVTDNNSGKLQIASITYYKWNTDLTTTLNGTPITSAGFINSYTPAALTVDLDMEINAKKTVTGEEYSMPAGVFQFVVKDSRGATVATGTNKAGAVVGGVMTADIDFSAFTFDRAAEYHYTITETNTGAAHFTYDTRQWEVRINVVYDYDKGYLKVDSVNVYEIVNRTVSTTETDPVFNNVYTPTPVQITIEAGKQLLPGNNANPQRALKAGEFTFQVLEEVAGVKIIRAEASNDAAGNVVFTFTETKKGTHYYVIDEVTPTNKQEGVTYDESTYAVTVDVEDDNGTLKAKLNGSSDASATPYTLTTTKVFTNKYAGTPVTATIALKKILHGAALTDGAFTFELVDAANPATVIDTATNDADGNIIFDITYSGGNAVGQYSYIVREVTATGTNITYDQSTVAITVDVVDSLTGKLSATVHYPADVTFENTYTPPAPPEDDTEHRAFAFNKKWNDNNNAAGKRPDSVVVEAYQDGVYVKDIVITEENGWTATEVLMYSQDDHVYTWTIKEKDIPDGYTAVYDQSSLTVTNVLSGVYDTIESPQTGDTNPIALLLGLASVSVLGIGALLITKKRQRKDA